MKCSLFLKLLLLRSMVLALCVGLALPLSVMPAMAQEPGEPVELALPAPMGSLKIVPLMSELVQMLENPYVAPTRRQSFGVVLPPLLIQPLGLNPLTAQPMALLFDPALAESEISWNIPSLDNVTFPFLAPLVGSLAVNPISGLLQRRDGLGVLVDIPAGAPGAPALGVPVNETDFIVNRTAANQLGKALFWDMQIGSDGVQACGSCHFHAGVDNRTKNQLNPNHLGGDFTLQVKGPNQAVVASDFPFHKLLDRSIPGEPLLNPGNVISDANDIMSSMGVVFSPFTDIPTPGAGAFGPAFNGVAPLLPDIRTPGAIDPIPVFQGVRRVEPRNTPTFHGVVFNFDNFWDGRARHDFNGGSVFGASDPFFHIFVDVGAGLEGLADPSDPTVPIRIRMSSLASLATGPSLSNFEMSFDGRNWAKIAKKLLQPGVTPLANQLVSTTDSVLGPLSNQNITPGMPGLNTTYPALIQAAFGAQFTSNTTQHFNGAPAPCTSAVNGVLTPAGCDPFDGYVLTIAAGAADPANTNQFTQMEANFSLFWGLALQAYGELVIPDDTPFDRFLDANPNQFLGTGFLTNPNVGLTPRQLHGLDLFIGTNHSGQNQFFKVARCGQCHNGPEMTDHSNNANHALILPDAITGVPRVISGFHLEEEIGENAQDAVEMDNLSFGLDRNSLGTGTLVPTFGQDINGDPTGHTLLDNGIYNIGVRPIDNDLGRGGLDPFGFPLSLATLAMLNVGVSEGVATTNPAYSVTPLTEIQRDPLTGEPIIDPITLLPITLQAGADLAFIPQLPPYLAPWANDFTVGEAWPFIDRNIFNPDTIDPQINIALGLLQGTYPNPNRIGKMGNFKAPSLRNVELTGPYFHTGSYLTLRQIVDFYGRGGDFPATNTLHRDPHILALNVNFFSQLTEAEKVALVDFLLALTDERVKFERAPFDRPEIFVPLDGTAPDNTLGRAGFVSNPLFRQVPAVGAAGRPYPLSNFLGVLSTGTVPPGTENLITSYYNNALDRAPDPAGLASWVAVAAQVTRRPSHFDSVISIATTFGISINEVFISIGKVIFNSPEYLSLNKTDNAYVVDLYQTFFGREPDPAGLANWVGLLTGGVSRNLVLNFFVFSAEFNASMEGIFGAIPSRPENDLVNDFYRGLLSRLPDAAGFEGWVTQMRNAQCAGAAAVTALSTQIAQMFIESPEYVARARTNAQFIEDLYDGILRRGSDLAGFNFWVNFLSTSTRAQVLQLFTASPEFQSRVQNVIDAGCSP